MMIDSTLFGVDIPAGAYAAGDVIELGCVAGPANVRSGRGAAYLKTINTGLVYPASAGNSVWKISIKNSDWIDEVVNLSGSMSAPAALDIRSGCNNFGHDCPLTPNSSWKVTAECMISVTTTAANSLYALLDVDYPQVASITDPAKLQGIPAGIIFQKASAPVNAPGTLTTSNWTTDSVDLFKAGYLYALEKVESLSDSTGTAGFIAIGNAAGQGGLTRIIPVVSSMEAIKQTIDYASSLVKGPMDIKTLLFNAGGTSATTATFTAILDYVKRRQ